MLPNLHACFGWYQDIHGGTLFASPQCETQSVQVCGLYLSDERFCPDIDFCDVFTLPIIKDTLADKELDVDYETRKGNVRAPCTRISFRSIKKTETVCKEDECITDFEASFIILIKGRHIKNRA